MILYFVQRRMLQSSVRGFQEVFSENFSITSVINDHENGGFMFVYSTRMDRLLHFYGCWG